MTETDIKCWHTKTTLHARGINKSRKMITFSDLISGNFNDNFKDNFMLEKVKSILVVLILSFASFLIFIIFTFGSVLKLTFFTSLLVTSLVSNAPSKLIHWDT